MLRFLAPRFGVPTLVQIEHVDLMDEASAALLGALVAALPSSSWLVVVTRREVDDGFVVAPGSSIGLELGPLSREDALALAEATPQAHVLPPHTIELAVERAGGQPGVPARPAVHRSRRVGRASRHDRVGGERERSTRSTPAIARSCAARPCSA